MTAPDDAASSYDPPSAAGAEVPDFTKRRPPIQFVIEPDTFRAPPVLGGFAIKKIAKMYGGLDLGALDGAEGAQAAIEVIADLMKVLMPGEHGRRFAERLLSDGDPGDPDADPPVPPSPVPIDLMGEAVPAFMFLIERYGLRPTVPSSVSPTGSTGSRTADPNAGISSTDGASPTELTTPN